MSLSNCDLCQGTGVMTWQQPFPDGVLRTVEHTCPRGCGGHWKHPAAEADKVIDAPTDLPSTRVRGCADEADEIGGGFISEAVRYMLSGREDREEKK